MCCRALFLGDESMSKLFATAVLGLGMALNAAAAEAPEPNSTITELKGSVSVNQGEEFRPAVKGMRLKPGDRVMAQDDSEADIKFDDECKMDVDENKIVTIPDRSTCAGGVPVVQELNPAGGSAIGAAASSGNGGVWAMVAIVAAIDIWWINEDDNDTVSP
jgi:hypothetical protein